MRGDPECTFQALGSWPSWRPAPLRAHTAAISESAAHFNAAQTPPTIHPVHWHISTCIELVPKAFGELSMVGQWWLLLPLSSTAQSGRMVAQEGITQSGSAQISPQRHLLVSPASSAASFFPWHNDAKSIFPQREAKCSLLHQAVNNQEAPSNGPLVTAAHGGGCLLQPRMSLLRNPLCAHQTRAAHSLAAITTNPLHVVNFV